MAAHALHRTPRTIFAALEFSRGIQELLTLIAADPLLARAPRGDGHPVMTLPGFCGADGSTALLRRQIARWGYAAHPWELGRNLDPLRGGNLELVFEFMRDMVGTLGRRLHRMHRRSGKRISLVGWSLGGLYARQLAAAYPDLVRQVITLGTPFGDPRSTIVWPMIQRLRTAVPPSEQDMDRWVRMTQVPIQVPLSAIWSRTDGFVHPSIATQQDGPCTESIHVCSSHAGFGANPLVFYVVADRLALPDGSWEPFERRGWRRLVYRD